MITYRMVFHRNDDAEQQLSNEISFTRIVLFPLIATWRFLMISGFNIGPMKINFFSIPSCLAFGYFGIAFLVEPAF
jgi:hypothetical protein